MCIKRTQSAEQEKVKLWVYYVCEGFSEGGGEGVEKAVGGCNQVKALSMSWASTWLLLQRKQPKDTGPTPTVVV